MPEHAVIHYYRYDRPPVIYTEGFIDDDGSRLRTRTEISTDIGVKLTAGWIVQGLIPVGSVIASVSKYHYYGEYFTILEFRDAKNELLGYYSDIAMPLEKIAESEYRLQDLILDLWVFPDQSLRELDWTQFETAERRGVIPTSLAKVARRTLARLVDETRAGRFPGEYISR